MDFDIDKTENLRETTSKFMCDARQYPREDYNCKKVTFINGMMVSGYSKGEIGREILLIEYQWDQQSKACGGGWFSDAPKIIVIGASIGLGFFPFIIFIKWLIS